MRAQSIAMVVFTVTFSLVRPTAQVPDSSTRLTVIGCVKRSQPDVAGTTGTTVIGPETVALHASKHHVAADANRNGTAELVARP